MRVRLAGSIALGALLLSACGGGAAPPAASPSSAAPASVAKPAASAPASASAKPAASTSAEASAKPAASGSAAPVGVPGKLNVSYSAIVPMTLPVWVANDEGLFQQNGLDVNLTYIESSKGIPAVIAGEIQVANIGGPETLSAVAGGADLMTVACESPYWPFVMQAVAGINSMQDLKGKKIGVSNFGSASDIATRIALEHENIDPNKDVSIIPVGSASNRIAALKSGAIQAGMSFPPDSYTMEQQGFKTIFDMGPLHLPGAVATDTMQRAWANANKTTVQKYVDSLVEALAKIRSDKARSWAST
jgi:NitT/TauT family transport system substrate-binding protein